VPSNGSKKKQRFITIKQAAEELKMSHHTLWRWVRENKNNFPVKHIGQRMLIPLEKFEAWCETTDSR